MSAPSTREPQKIPLSQICVSTTIFTLRFTRHSPARRGGPLVYPEHLLRRATVLLYCYRWLFFLAASNSSPGCQPATSGSAAARWPSANPNCAISRPTNFL
jgi:hypothetical protein